MNNQENKIGQKENEKSPKNKDMDDCDLNDRVLKTAVLKTLNEIQEN